MQVTQARLDRYRADVDAYGDAAATYVEQYLQALMTENPGMGVAELRDESIAAIDDALNAFGDQASALALDLFEEIVTAYGIEPETEIESVIPHEMIDSGVRYRARDLVEGLSDKFTRDVADLSRYYIHRSAFENMERNCERNDIRYARVPSGRETCGFCFMLSSRGFVYRSEETAGSTHAYHDHCDCVIVPGFEGLPASEQIEGYDPDEMRERWHDCQAAAGTDKELRDRWQSMTDRQRARYKGRSDGERYRRFANAQATREAETRDFRWLNTGEPPRIDTSSYSRKKLKRLKREHHHEWDGYVALSENGVKQKLDAEDRSASANIDFEWIADSGRQYWELKTPERDEWALVKLLEEGYSKWERLSANDARVPEEFDLSNLGNPRMVIDNRFSDMSDSDAERVVYEQMTYLTSNGSFDFSEAVLITKDGKLKRLINEKSGS